MFLGILCYYTLYKVVMWSTYDQAQRIKFKTKYLTRIAVIFILIMYKCYNDYNIRNCLTSHHWICTSSDKYSFDFKSDGTFQSRYDGGWNSGKWETTLLGDINMKNINGSNFDKELSYQIDFINSGEIRSGTTVYKSEK